MADLMNGAEGIAKWFGQLVGSAARSATDPKTLRLQTGETILVQRVESMEGREALVMVRNTLVRAQFIRMPPSEQGGSGFFTVHGVSKDGKVLLVPAATHATDDLQPTQVSKLPSSNPQETALQGTRETLTQWTADESMNDESTVDHNDSTVDQSVRVRDGKPEVQKYVTLLRGSVPPATFRSAIPSLEMQQRLALTPTSTSRAVIALLQNVDPPLSYQELDRLRTLMGQAKIPLERLADAVAFIRLNLPQSMTLWQQFTSQWHGSSFTERVAALRDAMVRFAGQPGEKIDAPHLAAAFEENAVPLKEWLDQVIVGQPQPSGMSPGMRLPSEVLRALQIVNDAARRDAHPLRDETSAIIEHVSVHKLMDLSGPSQSVFSYHSSVLSGAWFGLPSDVQVHVVMRRPPEQGGERTRQGRVVPRAYHVALGVEVPGFGPLNIHIDHVAGVVSVRIASQDPVPLHAAVTKQQSSAQTALEDALSSLGMRLGAIRVERYDLVDARRIDAKRFVPQDIDTHI